MEISKGRILAGVLATAGGLAAGYFGQPLVHGNDQAVNVIVTVFSVLAGFLVAIIAIVGDPLMMPPGSWRTAELQRKYIEARLIRHKWLFFLYLATLGLLFVSMIVPGHHPVVVLWVERLYLGLAATAFLLSLRLPGALMRMQQERIDAVIEFRRSAAGIPKTPPSQTTEPK